MEFIDWKSTSVILGPGPYGKAIFEKYPSWGGFIEAGLLRLLKKSRRTSVYLRHGNGQAFILKYYRTLPFPVRWPWLHGRPRRVWPIGVALEKAGVPVPANVALVRPSSGLTVILLECLADAVTLHAFVTAGKADERHFVELGRLAGRLHRAGVVHGDLKWSNIMVGSPDARNAPRFCLIDLDGAFWFKGDDPAARARDMARFLCDGIKERIEDGLLMAFLDGYKQIWSNDNGLMAQSVKRLARLLEKKGIYRSSFSAAVKLR